MVIPPHSHDNASPVLYCTYLDPGAMCSKEMHRTVLKLRQQVLGPDREVSRHLVMLHVSVRCPIPVEHKASSDDKDSHLTRQCGKCP